MSSRCGRATAPPRSSSSRRTCAASWPRSSGSPATAAVRVLTYDRTRGTMLLERVLPSTPLREPGGARRRGRHSSRRGSDGARCGARAPADHPFKTVHDSGKDLAGEAGRPGCTPSCATRSASSSCCTATCITTTCSRSGSDGWLAIDPAGVVGEREYGPGALLRNPWPGLLELPHPGRVLRRRTDQLAEALDLDVRAGPRLGLRRGGAGGRLVRAGRRRTPRTCAHCADAARSRSRA